MVCRKPKRPEWRFFVLLCPEMWRPKGRHKFLTVQGGATAPLAPPLGSALVVIDPHIDLVNAPERNNLLAAFLVDVS